MQVLEWAGGLYLDFLGLSGEIFFPSSVLSWEGDVQVIHPLSPPQKNNTENSNNNQDLCLELQLDINAVNVPGERTVHVGEGF